MGGRVLHRLKFTLVIMLPLGRFIKIRIDVTANLNDTVSSSFS